MKTKEPKNWGLVSVAREQLKQIVTCPIHGNAPLGITREGFKRLCLGYQKGTLIKKYGSIAGKTSYASNAACENCEIGRQIAAGKKFKKPPNITFIRLPKSGTRPKLQVYQPDPGRTEACRYVGQRGSW